MDVDEQELWLAEHFDKWHERLLMDDQWLHLKYGELSLDEVPDDAAMTTAQLIRRGFTRTSIEKHLSPVDDLNSPGLEPLEENLSLSAADNASNGYKTPSRYYSAAEAKKAAATPELKEWLERTKERRRNLRSGQKSH